MKRLAICLAILLACLSPLARADIVFTTGNVNLRQGPGLGYAVVTSVPADTTLSFEDDGESVSTDDRGVDWYRVYWKDRECWVSSRYAQWLKSSDEDPLEAMKPDLAYDPDKRAGYLEVTDWYGKPLAEAASALGLTERGASFGESPLFYRSDALYISGMDVVENVELTGQGYTVYGVCPGMDAQAAKAVLDASSKLEFDSESDTGISYNHIKDETAIFDYDLESDYMVTLELNPEGIVTQVWFSTYTG